MGARLAAAPLRNVLSEPRTTPLASLGSDLGPIVLAGVPEPGDGRFWGRVDGCRVIPPLPGATPTVSLLTGVAVPWACEREPPSCALPCGRCASTAPPAPFRACRSSERSLLPEPKTTPSTSLGGETRRVGLAGVAAAGSCEGGPTWARADAWGGTCGGRGGGSQWRELIPAALRYQAI